MNMKPVRIVLLGYGAINRRVTELLRTRKSHVEIAGIIRHSAVPVEDAPIIRTSAELVSVEPDLVVEAATREAVSAWGDAALRCASRLIVSSGSAFADDELLQSLRTTAKECGSQLVLSPGALAGIDALSAAARSTISEVRHRIVKPPAGWGEAAATEGRVDTKPRVLFSGSAREAASRYPLNANVTVVSALSGIGLDATQVELVCDPSARANRHEVRAVGEFGSLTLSLENRPLQSNPKSSQLAALALVRLIENERADVVL